MTFDWADLLTLAKRLQEEGTRNKSEAALRSAVSRAYFCAFCHARNFARDRQRFVPSYSVDDHAAVRRHFRDRMQAPVAAKLDNLRQWRDSCDYNDYVANLEDMCNEAMGEADRVLYILR